MNFAKSFIYGQMVAASLFILYGPLSIQGDLESTFARCCALGANWARQSQGCQNFPAPVPGEPTEHQSICLTTASICCLRFYREAECENAKQVAKSGSECTTSSDPGGEFFKDCCDGCKLGLVSGSMAMECTFQGFSFGFPWNEAYLECCVHASPPGSIDQNVLLSKPLGNNLPGHSDVFPDLATEDENFLYSNIEGHTSIPDSENLCLLFPGQLCGHVCVPTPRSYICQCRAGFTLSVDGKTCIQDQIKDRCEINNPCDHVCRDTGVSIECSCNLGYQLALDQRTCNDVNECLLGTHQCVPAEQVCFNQPGSYVCINSDGTMSTPGLSWGPGPRVRPEIPTLGAGSTSTNRIGAQGYSGTIDEADYSSKGICPPGYKFNLESRVCDDVDECAVAVEICGQGASCQNSIGSYSCTPLITGDCPSGFNFDLNHQSCLDIDECSLGTDKCGSSEICINIQGSYDCQVRESSSDCPPGYKYNSQIKICEDVNECLEGLHSCNPDHEICRNIIGAYECDMRCQRGFQFTTDPPSCVDVNECLVDLHTCNSHTESCVNTIGTYRCEPLTGNEEREFTSLGILPIPKVTLATPVVQECPNGYGFDLNTSRCLDINECVSGLHNCTTSTHKCINTLGGFLCTPKSGCSPGYAISPTSGDCSDVDECADGLSNCLPGQICVNTEGSFECRVECQDGFAYEPQDPAICVDINECLANPCNYGQQCKNAEGSYVCFGFFDSATQLPSTKATPALNATSAPSTTASTTTRAPCRRGYQRKTDISECKDVNECEEGLDHCLRTTEECINLAGSYTCRPRPCSRGFYRNPKTRECIDIDECSNLPCRTNEECINTPGSFVCRVRPSCHPGFRRDQTTQQCEDINECAEEALCDQNTQCINTRGSYRCRSLDCPAGYQGDPVTEQCQDVDECETGEHACKVPAEECVNSSGSYRCRAFPPCPRGFTRDPESFRCVDVDECVEGIAECGEGEQCINQYGRYRCKISLADCPRGYRYHSSSKRCQDNDECSENLHDCSISQTCVNSVGSFRCVDKKPVCDISFTFDEETKSCIDTDECVDAIHNCSRKEACINLKGSFTCRKNLDGEKHSSKLQEHHKVYIKYEEYIDECAEGLNLCSRTREKCINLPGAYRCDRLDATTQASTTPLVTTDLPSSTITTTTPADLDHSVCPQGYTFDTLFRDCKDVDECVRYSCSKHELCTNTPGSFSCDCKDGFVRDSSLGECKDMNECQLGLHTCGKLQRCDNTVGSYTCTRLSGCGTGYTLNHNTGKCEDDDECALGTNDCRQLGPKWKCVNTKGSFRCEKKTCPSYQILNSWGLCVNITCTPGYKPSNKKCVDINECTEEEFPCKGNERCFNFVGSYECRPKIHCGRGFEMNEAGTQCIDIDECEDGTHTCSGGQSCTNRPGGYVCQCPQGYRLDANRQCQDINECQTAYARVCGNTGECENTPGSYRCICKDGFKESSDGERCVDVDECSEVDGVCQHSCINVWGSYYCTCNAGYSLESSDNRTCTDIDECLEIRARGRLCLGICVNTPGTFKCTCPNGYRLDEDQRTCKDINECDSPGTCRNSEDICVNTRGSYRCQSITCPSYYVRDPNHRNRCKKEKLCLEDDAACLQQPLTYSYNFLPLASNMTLRPLGQVDLFTMRGPLWSTTNVQFDLELESATVGTEGVTPASREYFLLKRTAFNQVVLTLVRSLQGPQEVQLNLNMKLYHNGYYEGSGQSGLYCRKQCPSNDRECHFNSTQAVIYHFVALPSMPDLRHPLPLTALHIVSRGPWRASYSVDFVIMDGNEQSCFDVRRSSRSGWLRLIRPVEGPQRFLLRLHLDVVDHFRRRKLRSRTVALVEIHVANFLF